MSEEPAEAENITTADRASLVLARSVLESFLPKNNFCVVDRVSDNSFVSYSSTNRSVQDILSKEFHKKGVNIDSLLYEFIDINSQRRYITAEPEVLPTYAIFDKKLDGSMVTEQNPENYSVFISLPVVDESSQVGLVYLASFLGRPPCGGGFVIAFKYNENGCEEIARVLLFAV